MPGGVRKHNFWTARVNSKKNHIRNPDVESYQLVYIWVDSGREGGGVPGVVLVFLGPPLQFFLGIFTGFSTYRWNSQLNPVDWHPF